jgi:hypothetical protein
MCPLFPAIFIVVFVTAILEMLASLLWLPIYFRHGVRIFIRRVPHRTTTSAFPNVDELSEMFKGTWGPSLAFKALSLSEIAFREKVFEFKLVNATPIMHGLIQYQVNEGQIEIKGYLNWGIAGFALMMIILPVPLPGEALFVSFFVAILALCYYIQLQRYNRLVRLFEERSKTVA